MAQSAPIVSNFCPSRLRTPLFNNVTISQLKLLKNEENSLFLPPPQIQPSNSHKSAHRAEPKISRWEDEVEQTLENLPDDLFAVYDRFLERIPPKDWVYVEAILRWTLYLHSDWGAILMEQLADAIAFDLTNSVQYVYKPTRRQRNIQAISDWLEGLIVYRPLCNELQIELAHASVQDYILSEHFSAKFHLDLSHCVPWARRQGLCPSTAMCRGAEAGPATVTSAQICVRAPPSCRLRVGGPFLPVPTYHGTPQQICPNPIPIHCYFQRCNMLLPTPPIISTDRK
ncbi:hypothetical protein B0H17DRAFT_1186973 [Mycena rosella]|uniref:Uncharacterized protein n=1 Tax=Mycena rosella TaxID=1033263 RepID=A0AAD7FY04_MYCRO|nr:hypothetical protein B0H17DRAFT_1186973 [Mycena rosella]